MVMAIMMKMMITMTMMQMIMTNIMMFQKLRDMGAVMIILTCVRPALPVSTATVSVILTLIRSLAQA